MTVVAVCVVLSWRSEAQLCQNAGAVRLNQSGLEFLGKQVEELLPPVIPLPEFTFEVGEIPVLGSPVTVHSRSLQLGVNLASLEFSTVNSALRIKAHADLHATGPLKVINAYVVGSADCESDVVLRDANIDISIEVTAVGGTVQVRAVDGGTAFDRQLSDLALRECALGDLINVVSVLEEFLLDKISSMARTAIEQNLATMLSEKLQSAFQVDYQFDEFFLRAQVAGAHSDASGMTVQVGADVILDQYHFAPCLQTLPPAPDEPCDQPNIEPAPYSDAMFGAAVSESMMNRMLLTLWRSGRLCINSNNVELPLLKLGIDQAAAALALPDGTQLQFDMRLGTPPHIRFNEESRVVQLEVRDVAVQLVVAAPGGQPGQVSLEADISVNATPRVDQATNSIALTLNDAVFDRLKLVDQGVASETIRFDPARLQRFVSKVLVPVLQERLASRTLSPAVISVTNYLVEMKKIEVQGGSLAAYFDAFRVVDSDDTTPPDTAIKESVSSIIGPTTQAINVTGTDNETPPHLLRFIARVDQGEWSEPHFGGRVNFSLGGGAHSVEIAAMDLQNNVDPSPISFNFTVDGVPPELVIVSRPGHLVDGAGPIRIEFDGQDDRTPSGSLSYKVELLRVPAGGGQPEVVNTFDLNPGVREITFNDIANGVYKARVIVSDEVGNVTSQDVGFVVDSGGCNAGGTSSGTGWWIVLLAGLWFCGRHVRTISTRR